MVFGKTLQRFVEQKPLSVMARVVLQRQLSASRLDALFEATAQQQYTKELLFSMCAELLCQVTLCGQPSVHRAFLEAKETIPASVVAVYDKLKGTEPAVCEALVAETAREVEALLAHLGGNRPEPIPGYRLRVADGNVLAGTEHRLKVLRGTGAAALPGQSLVLYDYAANLISNLVVCEDGHTNERCLMPRLLPLIAAGDLLLADRNFATRDLLMELDRRQAGFVIRHHASLKLEPLTPQRRVGPSRTGLVFEQQVRLSCGLICRALIIRRQRPLRDGGRRVILLTNVPRGKETSACKLAELYLQRWTIEEAFRQLTQYLSCEVRTLGYPKAALLAFSLAVTAYNCMAGVQGALASVHGRDKVDRELSPYYLAVEIQRNYEGMAVAVPDEEWQVFAALNDQQLAEALRHIAAGVRWDRYAKAPRGQKKPVQRQKVHRGAHVATARLLLGNAKAPRKQVRTP